MEDVYWPSLYSRLAPGKYARGGAAIDHAGSKDGIWGPEKFLIDLPTLKRHIEIDLLDLMNSTCLEATLFAAKGQSASFPFDSFPRVRRSIINYGLPTMIGRLLYHATPAALELDIRDAIVAFEPRLKRETVKVRLELAENDKIDPSEPIRLFIEAKAPSTRGDVIVRMNTIWDLEKVRSQAMAAR